MLNAKHSVPGRPIEFRVGRHRAEAQAMVKKCRRRCHRRRSSTRPAACGILCHLQGSSNTSIQVGQDVISCREYLGPHPLAKLMRTAFGSTGPTREPFEYRIRSPCGLPVNMLRQWPDGTRNTRYVLLSGSSSVGELTNIGQSLRLYAHTPSSSRLRARPVVKKT